LDKAKFIKEMEASIEDLEPGILNAETRFRELPVWDSLAVLTVSNMIDLECGVTFSGEDLRKFETVGALWEEVERRKGDD